jgi:hypothetical protein
MHPRKSGLIYLDLSPCSTKRSGEFHPLVRESRRRETGISASKKKLLSSEEGYKSLQRRNLGDFSYKRWNILIDF